ncbi:MAG: DUF962 domain-containing protein [Acidiferrobacterales bacterium]|nr:DUF962 domain-containing protein [Acidiferrobacterales bacterium]
MRKIDELLDEYGASHQTGFNKKVHFICVPAIFFSVLGLLYCIPVSHLFSSYLPESCLPYANFAIALMVFGIGYYATLSVRLMIAMLVMSVVSYYLILVIEKSQTAPLWIIMTAIFLIAWVGQFIGHKHEGKKPSFFEDLQFLMIGPAWTLSHFFKRFGVAY